MGDDFILLIMMPQNQQPIPQFAPPRLDPLVQLTWARSAVGIRNSGLP
jgi:hypothetical protein